MFTGIVTVINAQQNFNDFEGNGFHIIDYKSGKINTRAKNPRIDEINSSKHCASYTRTSSEPFDHIKLLLIGNLKDVSDYANYKEDSPKIKMKVYTSAPLGTMVEIHLGKQTLMEYPFCIHSQYQVRTTKQNQWEQLEFSFSQIPKGSKVKSSEVNQITILFAPETKGKKIFYFDDLTGPLFLEKKTIRKNKKFD